MDSATGSRSANKAYVLLLAVAFAGFITATLAVLGLVSTYATIRSRSFAEEFEATFARESAFAMAWSMQWPFLVVGLTLGILGTIAVRKHQQKPEHRRWRPILLGLVLSIPLSIAVTLLTVGLLVVWPDSFAGSDKVRVENDLDKTVTITFCPKQDCSGQRPQQLNDGDHLDYKIRTGDVPDSVVVQDRDHPTRCGLLPLAEEMSELKSLKIDDTRTYLSDNIDTESCGADVDSMDPQ